MFFSECVLGGLGSEVCLKVFFSRPEVLADFLDGGEFFCVNFSFRDEAIFRVLRLLEVCGVSFGDSTLRISFMIRFLKP